MDENERHEMADPDGLITYEPRVPAMMSPEDLRILMDHKYGNAVELKRALKITMAAQRLEALMPITAKERLMIDAVPRWNDWIKDAPPTLPNGMPNPQYYRNSLSWLTARALSTIDQGGSVTPAAAKAIIEEVKQLGLDLTANEHMHIFDWLKHKDLLTANEVAMLELLRQIRKIPPMGAEQEKLKKKWIRLLVVSCRLQRWAKQNELVAWTYIGRNQENGKPFDWQEFHTKSAEIVMSGKNILLVMPSGFGKTCLILGLMLCRLGRQPNLRILLLFNSQDVTKRVEYVRQWIVHPRFRALFPAVEIDAKRSDTKSGFFLRRDTPSIEPSIEGKTVLQKAEGVHYDIIADDDVHTRESAESEAARYEVNEAMDNTWKKRLNPGGQSISTGTRWHEQDRAGIIKSRVLAAKSYESQLTGRRDIDVDRVIYEITVPFSTTAQGVRVPTASPWENRFPLSQLLDEQRTAPVAFARDRYADPVSQADQAVTKLVYYDPAKADPIAQLLSRWLSVDPATGTTEYANFSGCVLVHLGLTRYRKPIALVRDVWRVKKHPGDLAKFFVELFDSRQIDDILYETRQANQQELFVPEILAILAKGKQDYRPYFHKWPGMAIDKTQRLKACGRMLEYGDMQFPGHETKDGWVSTSRTAWLTHQILKYPSTENDDGLDAVTQFLLKNRAFLEQEHQEEAKKVVKTVGDRIYDQIMARLDEQEELQQDDIGGVEENELAISNWA